MGLPTALQQLESSLLQTRLVGGLPDLGKCHGTVEPMENAEGQCDALNDRPGHKAIEIQLHLCIGRAEIK